MHVTDSEYLRRRERFKALQEKESCEKEEEVEENA
jgi:hypothetical protein